MKPQCFSECVIGVRGSCDCDDPQSGYFIDDLGAISLKKADKTTDGVAAYNGEELIKQSQDFAIKKVMQDLLGELDPQYQFNQIFSSTRLKNAGNTSTGYFDYSVFINNHYCDDVLVEMQIEDVLIYSFDNGTATITVYEDEEQVLQITQYMTVGKNKLNLAINTFAQILEIRIQGVEIGRSKRLNGCYNCSQCLTTCEQRCWTMHGKSNENNRVQEVWVDMVISCRCSLERFICSVKEALYMPILYATGINFLHKVLNSDRINYYVSNSAEKIEKMLLNWAGGLDVVSGIKQNGEYAKQLTNAKNRIEALLKNTKSACISCKGSRITSDLTLPDDFLFNNY